MDNIQIKKETKKAYLVEKDNLTFWIQKRWINKEKKLTKAGLNAFEEAKHKQKFVERDKKALGDFKFWNNEGRWYDRETGEVHGYGRFYDQEGCFAHISYDVFDRSPYIREENRRYFVRFRNKNLSTDNYVRAFNAATKYFAIKDMPVLP